MTFTTTTTVLTNPGIINRLELDVVDLHQWGFRIERLSDGSSHAANNAVFHTPPLQHNHKPLGTMHLHVFEEKLLSTVGPLLRTYVRLSHPGISPMCLRAIVHCDFIMIVDDEEDVAKSKARIQREENKDSKNFRTFVLFFYL